jgi:hypothetical protein
VVVEDQWHDQPGIGAHTQPAKAVLVEAHTIEIHLQPLRGARPLRRGPPR